MDQNSGYDNNSDETSLSVVKKVFRIPAGQEDRINSATLGLVSLGSAAGIYLLRGITSLLFPGLLVTAVLGTASWWMAKKYPRNKQLSYVVAGLAAVTFVNAIPALSGIGGFVLGLTGFAALAFGVWKLASTVISIFRKK